MDHIIDAILGGTPGSRPVVALSGLILGTLVELDHHAATCVNTCETMRHALAYVGIESETVGVTVDIDDGRNPARYGADPEWDAADNFRGHAALSLTDGGRFCDPTVQQFPGVARQQGGDLPVVASVPRGRIPDGSMFRTIRGDLTLTYTVLSGNERSVCTQGLTELQEVQLIRNGAFMAGMLVELLRGIDELGGDLDPMPYPDLQQLVHLAKGHSAQFGDVGDETSWPTTRFEDPNGRSFECFTPPW